MSDEQALRIALMGIAYAFLIPIVHRVEARYHEWRMTHRRYRERVERRQAKEAASYARAHHRGYRLGLLVRRCCGAGGKVRR